LISTFLLVAMVVAVSPTKADLGTAAAASGNAIGIMLNAAAGRATSLSLPSDGGAVAPRDSGTEVLVGETVTFFAAANLILSLGAGWWAATKGGQHRDDAAHAGADRTVLSDLPASGGAEKPVMWFMRIVIFVPGAVGFLLGLVAAPLIIGFRMGLELINNESVHAFAPDPGLGAPRGTNTEIGRSP
jgi:hypothetical protein